MKSQIRWKKPTTWLVIAFLITWMIFRSFEARADTIAEMMPSTSFVAGHHQNGAGVMMGERFADRYDVGIMLMTAQRCDCERGDSPGNMGIQLQRVVSWRAFELGLGAAYWSNQTPAWNSHTTFALYIGYERGNWIIRHRHYSTGGSSDRNGGLDMITIGYRFE